MCGIAGIISTKTYMGIREDLDAMCGMMEHRGPDGQGIFVDEQHTYGLGHRRLSIIDLSESGHQPMHVLDRYLITFNGEIYNYLEIKEKLQAKGHLFRTQTDTEVLILAYHEWGVDCLNHLDGMFAFVLIDQHTNEVFCARDRFGEKPFFYTIHEDRLYFASEIKCFWAIHIPKQIEEERLFLFLAEDLVENPLKPDQTFFKNIQQVPPGHYLKFACQNVQILPKKYWELQPNGANEHLSFDQAKDEFLQLLRTSLNRRLRSDVRVGCSLSGGLDSSTVVALMSESTHSIHTVSARFKNFSKDEGPFIDLVTQKFHTNHTNTWVHEDVLNQHLDRLLFHQDEPFQTGSILAQYMVYAAAKENDITVMLDGQGADEMLAGYEKDFQVFARELIPFRSKCNTFQQQIKENHNWDVALSWKDHLLKRFPHFYAGLSGIKKQFKPIHYTGLENSFAQEFAPKESPFEDFTDLKKSLVHQLTKQGLQKLLRFADRNSMAHSVEVRLPFLNHQLAEFVLSLPNEYLLYQGWSKALLRESMSNSLPEEIVYRKNKIGFEAPHNSWLGNEKLKERVRDARERMVSEKIITPDYTNDWKVLMASYYL